MASVLQQLREMTTVVADTGEIEAIKKFQPVDATTNPSLLLKAAQIPEYVSYLDEAVSYAKSQSNDPKQQLDDAGDKLAVLIGKEISAVIPGRISTEVDARLSFDTAATIAKAHKLIKLYEESGISKDRVLIKVASTWEGIKAAEQLEQEGIQCNLTLLFSFAQARACAEAGVYLISPFVGRILDWYKANTDQKEYTGETDPGVISVRSIYQYYKQHGYQTVVMGASFRNTDEIKALAGCDRLTIAPALLDELEQEIQPLERKLTFSGEVQAKPEKLTEAQFRWDHNEDPMATLKLAEGISNFAKDQVKLEALLQAKL
ncbi:transaldolase [Psychrosphaera sp. B3R10]|uniref:transaldolase n=1 Tax=unclassified Psychrosphaera TaxID=2641570 RepID=UPI001C0A00D6|nr:MULTISPECIES: transaldolase [unclassified Psychrosphaera]MBU2882984.1 transaldolase [Psychrosphaera sp. I2R16]MBU2991381.1 transaldolase [Psychrosphaera sp. B3R10]MDO6720270.1 transaldolase [Psychrosphaera sp. 1_MG-2023]